MQEVHLAMDSFEGAVFNEYDLDSILETDPDYYMCYPADYEDFYYEHCILDDYYIKVNHEEITIYVSREDFNHADRRINLWHPDVVKFLVGYRDELSAMDILKTVWAICFHMHWHFHNHIENKTEVNAWKIAAYVDYASKFLEVMEEKYRTEDTFEEILFNMGELEQQADELKIANAFNEYTKRHYDQIIETATHIEDGLRKMGSHVLKDMYVPKE